MNNINLVGRFVKDVELSVLNNSEVKKISGVLAVDRSYKKEGRQNTDFINVEYLGKNLDKLASYLKKGTLVAVNGELHIDNYKVGEEFKSFTKVSVSRLELLGGKDRANTEKQDEEKCKVDFSENNEFNVDDEDIPF